MAVVENQTQCILQVKNEFAKNELDIFPHYLQTCLNNIVRTKDYKTYNVFKRTISTEGGNYLAELSEIDVKGRTGKGSKETNLFIKEIIPTENNKIFSIAEAYVKESYAYTELSRIFTDLQDEAYVPFEERFKMAKNYECSAEAIILENLSKKGFKTCHRMEVVPLKFAELSIQQLAKFHGLSYVLQKKRPMYTEQKVKSLKQFFKFNNDWKSFTKNMCEMSSKNLSYASKKKMERFYELFWEKYPKYLEDTTSIGCCLCHGDYRANNILMKEVEGEIKEVIPVDFQLLYYGSPLNDFIYFIFSCTDKEFRRQHLTNLKDMYYNTLSRFLLYFNMDIQEIYPRKEFEKKYKEILDYGLMVAMFLVPFCFASEDDVPDIGKVDMAALTFNLDKRFEERIQGIVDDFIEWGYV